MHYIKQTNKIKHTIWINFKSAYCLLISKPILADRADFKVVKLEARTSKFLIESWVILGVIRGALRSDFDIWRCRVSLFEIEVLVRMQENLDNIILRIQIVLDNSALVREFWDFEDIFRLDTGAKKRRKSILSTLRCL